MLGNVSQQASLPTRVRVWFEAIPLFTKSLLLVCVGVYALQLLLGLANYGAVCLSANDVISRWQVYRLVSAALVHAGLLHLAFNMLAFVPIGASLERSMGTLQFAWLVGLLALVGDALYVAAAYLSALLPARLGLNVLAHCAVGLSGVIFGLIVAETAASGAASRSVLGLFAVPARAYPWALLLLWQLLVPGVSFLGHLSGLLAGQLYVLGWLRRLMPSAARTHVLEGSALLAPLLRRPSFIVHTGGGSAGAGSSLPTSYTPQAGARSASGASGGLMQQGGTWFRPGGWLPLPVNDDSPPWRGGFGSASGGARGGFGSASATGGGGRSWDGSHQAGAPASHSAGAVEPGRGHKLGGGAAPATPWAAAVAARHGSDGAAQAHDRGKQPLGHAQQLEAEGGRGPPPGGDPALQQLMAMGFDRGAAAAALAAAGSVAAALELLSGQR